MKVTFLGTSHGRPEADRHCSATMLELENGDAYLVDTGAPIADMVYELGKQIEKLKGVFITHLHSDHLDGIFCLLTLVTTRYNMAFDIILPGTEVYEHIKRYVELTCKINFPSDKIRFIEPSEGRVFEGKDITVDYFETKHIPPEKTYGMVIKAEGKTLVFSGDMSGGLKGDDFPKYALENPTDFIVCEMAHFTFSDLAPYIKRVNTKTFCINHINRAEKYSSVSVANESGEYDFPIIAVKDADEFKI